MNEWGFTKPARKPRLCEDPEYRKRNRHRWPSQQPRAKRKQKLKDRYNNEDSLLREIDRTRERLVLLQELLDALH